MSNQPACDVNPSVVDGNIVGIVRRKHISLRSLLKATKTLGGGRPPVPDYERPKTRGDCENTERPCPFVGCRHHLALDEKAGALRISGETAAQLQAMRETCSLDVADEGTHTLPEVAALLGVSRQRVSQVEIAAMRKLRKYMARECGATVDEFLPEWARLGDEFENCELEPGNDDEGYDP